MALKHLEDWRTHLNKVWAEMKKKNPKTKLSEAMVEASKSYKKLKGGTK